MLPRGFYGALSFWPTVFWPLIFSSAFYAFLRCCHLSRAQYGFSPLDGAPTPQLVAAWLFVSAAAVFELLAHPYLLWRIGYFYAAIALPIYVASWVVPRLLEDFRPALLLLPLVHVWFAAAFIVLLGFADIQLLRQFNSALYALLTGVRVAL